MSTTKTSQAKDTKEKKTKNSSSTIWVLSVFFSPYRVGEYDTYCRRFVSKELAQGAMRREARRLYKNSVIIQGEESKYYEEYPMEIHFGERSDRPDYKREFGHCKIEPYKVEDKESGDDVPSSTDDESTDDESD